jgi:hypothetical protein
MRFLKSSILVIILFIALSFLYGSICNAETNCPKNHETVSKSPPASSTNTVTTAPSDDDSGVDDNYNSTGSFDEEEVPPASEESLTSDDPHTKAADDKI